MMMPAWAELIRTIPDFPEPGVQFKDITPLLADPQGLQAVVNAFADRYANQSIDAIVVIESRGFVLGTPVAYRLGTGVVLVRKPGKLPGDVLGMDYALEYGTNRLEMHRDALKPGARVVILDDVLATGGTARAAADLVLQLGGEVVEYAFLIELGFLNGRSKITDHSVFSLLHY